MRDGRAAGKTPACASARGDAGTLARRSCGDAWASSGNGEIKIVFCTKATCGEIAMPCENYREALTEAAAADAVPSGELRSHLDACASCRTAFTEEQQLFAAIDTGLRASANSDVPATFLPRVRANLENTSTTE